MFAKVDVCGMYCKPYLPGRQLEGEGLGFMAASQGWNFWKFLVRVGSLSQSTPKMIVTLSQMVPSSVWVWQVCITGVSPKPPKAWNHCRRRLRVQAVGGRGTVNSRSPHSRSRISINWDNADQILMPAVLFFFSHCCAPPVPCQPNSHSWAQTVSFLWTKHSPELPSTPKSLITIFIPAASANDLLLHG
jgi:hypothetical protein